MEGMSHRQRAVEGLLFAAGAVSLAVGVIGVFLPLLPTTPFLLLAAWCFVRSSPRAHAWLYRQKVIGPALRDWEERKAISRRAKTQAVSLIVLSAALIWWRVKVLPVKIGVTVLLAAVSAFILTRKER